VISIDCDEWIADEHDDPACTCESCERVRSRDGSEAKRRDALAAGGLFPLAHELLGPGWVDADGKGGLVTDTNNYLAQRALAETFDQLERIGDAGRKLSYPSAYTTPPPADPQVLGEMLELAEQSIAYARTLLRFVPPAPAPRLDFDVGVTALAEVVT
jgi:hypothetical protein